MKPFLLFLFSFFIVLTAYSQDANDCLVYTNQFKTPPPVTLKGSTISSPSGKYNMAWLDKEFKSKQGILIGENHWMNTVNAMAKDIIFRANEVDYFPTLILELPYSVGFFINDYLNCQGKDCEKALAVIKPYYSTKEGMALLQDLKAWNAAHPEKKITVVCSDIEQNYVFSLLNIYIPYFSELGINDLKERVNAARDVTPEIYAYMDSVISASPASTVVKNRPFLAKARVQEAFGSFSAYYQAIQAARKSGDDADFMKVRASGIYENLTSPARIGGRITNGKFILWGGSEHVRIYQYGDEEFLKYEGWRLANDFAPLKDKLVSVRLENLSFGIPEVYNTSDIYKKGTPQFASLVDGYKSCNKVAGAYEMWIPTPVVQAALPNFQKNQDQPVWFKGKRQMTKLAKKSPELAKDYKLKQFYSHDYVVLLPHATLFERID